MTKTYWTWTCHVCGYGDNRNTNESCAMCGARGRCETLGGHYFKAGSDMCDNGCGLKRDGSIDMNQRRADY